jgi:Domain of unknown function (DUF222)
MPDEPSADHEPRDEANPLHDGDPVVPECFDAGFLPRDADGTASRRPGRGGDSGFASGGALDTALPGPALAGFADAVTGTGQGYAEINDDELIGVLVAWQKTESWAAAGKLSAVAELIRRRPVTGFADPSDPDATSGAPGDAGGPGGSSGPGSSPACRGEIRAEWGKFCADELAVALKSSRLAAERMLALAHDLASRLPGTARALREGLIDVYKARIIAEASRVLDGPGASAAEAFVIADIAGKSPGQIRAAIGRAVLRVDPGAARQRREQAQRDARVELWREDAGTAALCGFGLPPDEALAADQMISARARDLKAAGVAGTIDQLRVRAYLDFLLGQDTRPTPGQPEPGGCGQGEQAPGGTGKGGRLTGDRDQRRQAGRSSARDPASGSGPANGDARAGEQGEATDHGPASEHSPAGHTAGPAARINLTIPLATLLGLADHPGDAAGFGPIDAALARTMATAAAASPATTWCVTVTDQHGHPTAHGCARPGRRTGPQPQPSPATGPPGGRTRTASGGTGPPGDQATPNDYGTWRLRPTARGPDLTVDLEPIAVTDCDHRHQTSAHDPGDRLRHLVEIRDGECTWPPCRRSARHCDFEHAIPWEHGGRTCMCNAGARCRHHHHQKQAPGWRLDQHLPGHHTWTTPSGRQYTTGPTTYPI